MVERDQQATLGVARAKINLTLHVGAAISDGAYKGYHPVDSLVVFADIGDQLSYDVNFGAAGTVSLNISGPFSKGLEPDENNLILKAAHGFFKARDLAPRGQFSLVKNLPLASGIGGGSADAAAAFELLVSEFNIEMPSILSLAAKIGADVPVCCGSKTAHMHGIGERVDCKDNLGAVPAILVNPGFAVSTADIFKAFDSVPSDEQPKPQNWHGDLYDIAMAGQNDLQEIAISLRPEISNVIAQIALQNGCRLARMSGSGATCFGLFHTQTQSRAAAQAISAKYPHYWCQDVMLGEL